MTAYEDMDEELRRIYDEGSASAQPAELAELRAQLAQQDAPTELPKGTKVTFASFEPEVAAPVSVAERMPIVPKVVDLTNEPTDDMELAAARVEDRQARSREAMERGTRQLIGGLTRTEALPSTPGPTDAVAQLLARRRERDARERQANQDRTAAGKVDFERAEAARKAALHEQERGEDKARDERDFTYRQTHDADALAARKASDASRDRNTAAMLGVTLQGAKIRQDEADAKKQDRDDKLAAGSFPLVGGTFTIKKGLDDSAANKARSDGGMWNQALGNIDSLQGSLSGYIQKPSLEGKAQVEAQLQGALTALNAAYGQGAMADNERKALSQALGADVMTPTGIVATVQSWLSGDAGQAGHLLLTKIRTLREAARKSALQKMSPYGEFADGVATTGNDSRPIVKNPKTGERRYLNADGSLGEVVT